MSRKSTLSVARKGMLQTRPRLFGQSQRNCPKSPDKLRTEAPKVDETGRGSPISLPGTNKMKTPVAPLTPFRTVSEGTFSETHIQIPA